MNQAHADDPEAPWLAPFQIVVVQGTCLLNGSDTPQPPVFMFRPNDRLVLDENAVVMVPATRRSYMGPKKIDYNIVAKAVQGQSAPEDSGFISLKPRRNLAGATRGISTVSVARPVPGSTVVELKTVAWKCASCGTQLVKLKRFDSLETAWSGEGSGQVIYDGPPLLAGRDYLLTVGKQAPVYFVAADEKSLDRLRSSREGLDEMVKELTNNGVSESEAQIFAQASLYFGLGYHSDALWLLDEALTKQSSERLNELRAWIETQEGIAL